MNAIMIRAKQQSRRAPSPIQQIVRAHRLKLGARRRPLSFAKFAVALTDVVESYGFSVSYQSIKNWEDGVFRPDYAFIMQLSIHAPQGSWQRAFASDLLAAQWPELYKPGSEIGERLIQQAGK